MDMCGKLMAGALLFTYLVMGTNMYQTAVKTEQDKRNARQWTQERALIEQGRLERLYHVQCESLNNIPYVAIESKESDRMEKLYRLHFQQQSNRAQNLR